MDSEVLQRWERSGYLEGLSHEKKVVIAGYFQKAADLILNGMPIEHEIQSIAFPVLRCIASQTDKELCVMHIIFRLNRFFRDKFKEFDSMFPPKFIDTQAEFTYLFCQYEVARINGEKMLSLFTKKVLTEKIMSISAFPGKTEIAKDVFEEMYAEYFCYHFDFKNYIQ
jgi:hypothetical protein